MAAQEETNPAGRGGVSTTAAEGGIEYELGAEILRGISKKIRLLKQADQPIDRQAYAAEYVEAISHFKEVIQKYPDSPLAVNALPRIRSCFWVLDQPEQLADYVNSLINDSKYQAIKPYAQYLLIPYLLYKEDYDLTLQLSDEILAGPPNDVLACEVLYGKGIIYQHYLNDLEAAAEIYRQVIAEYPDHPTALSAQAELENMGEEYVPGDSTSTQLVSGEPVIVSYPNPFNPTVMIRFSLPEASSLQLTVYDIMGREVIRLVDGYMEAGRQQVVWNGKTAGGRNVPTGIYIVRLITPAATRNIKLVLLR